MKILVIGAGYAGLVTAAGLADLGHLVTNLDLDTDRIDLLKRGQSPLFEPGLQPILDRVTAAGRLAFVDSYGDAGMGHEVVFLVVGSPPLPDGSVDLGHLLSATESVAPLLSDGTTIAVKSTVPVGSSRMVMERVRSLRPDIRIEVVANPEFLRQGAAVTDFLEPERIVIGTDSDDAAAAMRHVYHPLIQAGTRAVFTTLESAEIIKYAANAFLATKLSFINEIADLCEATGAAVTDVASGIGFDSRIGQAFLKPGPGFGGSCLPKDTAGLLHTTREFGIESRILAAVLEVNRSRVGALIGRIERAVGSDLDGQLIALLGLTFKANTDDLRESPAVHLAKGLIERGATVRVFDPEGMDRARDEFGGLVEFAADEYEAADGAAVAIIATEWKQFGSLSLDKLANALARPVVVDFRNLWDPAAMADAGIRYYAVGRPDPS